MLQDILFNAKERKGLVYNKFFYKKYRKNDLVSAMENMELSTDVDNMDGIEELSAEEQKDAMLFFRTCMLERDRKELIVKLKQTIKSRETLIKQKGIKFHQVFPFYFLDPSLVCCFLRTYFEHLLMKIFQIQISLDFEIRTACVRPSALIEKWPTMKYDIYNQLSLSNRDECSIYFDKEIGYFIALLKLLSTNTKFKERLDSFLIFNDVMN